MQRQNLVFLSCDEMICDHINKAYFYYYVFGESQSEDYKNLNTDKIVLEQWFNELHMKLDHKTTDRCVEQLHKHEEKGNYERMVLASHMLMYNKYESLDMRLYQYGDHYACQGVIKLRDKFKMKDISNYQIAHSRLVYDNLRNDKKKRVMYQYSYQNNA